MPPAASGQLLRVVINRNGHPKQELRNVCSVMEVSDEDSERVTALSFYAKGAWHQINLVDFDRITIEKERYTNAD